jgi:hypothetical protein
MLKAYKGTEMEKKIFNMLILGVFLEIKPIKKIEKVIESLRESITESYQQLIPSYLKVISSGMKISFLIKRLNLC